MTTHSTEISLPARHDELPRLLAWVEAMAETAGVVGNHRRRLQLVVEELFTNTIEHGCGRGSPGPITVTLTADSSRASVRYADRAPPFDIAAAESPPPSPERIGGFGLKLVRTLAQAIRYQYREGANITELDFEF